MTSIYSGCCKQCIAQGGDPSCKNGATSRLSAYSRCAHNHLLIPLLVNKLSLNSPLTLGVHTSLTKWLDCVLCVQERRRKEVLGWVDGNNFFIDI